MDTIVGLVIERVQIANDGVGESTMDLSDGNRYLLRIGAVLKAVSEYAVGEPHEFREPVGYRITSVWSDGWNILMNLSDDMVFTFEPSSGVTGTGRFFDTMSFFDRGRLAEFRFGPEFEEGWKDASNKPVEDW